MSNQELVKEEQTPEEEIAPVAGTDAEPITEAESEPPAAEAEPEPVAEAESEPPAAEAEPEPVVEAEAEPPAAEAEPEPVAEAESEPPAAEAEPEPVAEAESEPPAAEAEPEPVAEAESEPPAAEAEPEPVVEAEAEPPAAEADAEPVAEAEAASDETSADGTAAESSDDEDADTIFDLKPRQQLVGTVKNITSFGAFVDVGLPQDGLVHISELSRKKVDKVGDVVSVRQEVEVWVKKVDKKRGRISLTMIKPIGRRLRDISEGEELTGTVTRLESYGAFVNIDSERDGLVHISQITHDYIKHPEESLSVGDEVQVKVLKVNRRKRQIDISIKALLPPPASEQPIQNAPELEEAIEEATEDEPIPTAMAVAFANLQSKVNDDQSDSDENAASVSDKMKREQDELISRTLATNN